MPNFTGAFLDQNPDIVNEEVPTPDDAEEIADAQVYAGLHFAQAKAAPDIEFMMVPVPPGTAYRILSEDMARSRISIAADTGAMILSSVNLSAIFPNAGASAGSVQVTAAIPGFVVPDIGSGQLPYDFHTQSELWVYNNAAGVQRVWYAVERYAGA